MPVTKLNITDSINKFNGIINNLESCASTLDKSIKEIKIQKHTGGGDKLEKMHKKLNKYKQMIRNATYTVQYFKSLAEYYYASHIMTTQYYQGVISKMTEMKDKMKNMNFQMNNIQTQYDNNEEKIQMLETFLDMIEKMTKSPTKIDLNIKSKINSNGLELGAQELINSQEILNKTKFVPIVSGGSKSFEELETAITESENIILNSFSNIEFLNNKIGDLNKRMKEMIKDNEDLFKIKAEIEFTVNKLEECIGEKCDQKVISHDFDRLWEIINKIQERAKSTGELDTKMVDYISGLEKYVSMLESQINSSTRIANGMRENHKEEINKLINEQIETGENPSVTKLDPNLVQTAGFVGGAEEDNEISSMEKLYNEKIPKNISLNKQFTDSCQYEINLENIEAKTHGQLAFIYSMLSNISKLLDLVNETLKSGNIAELFKSNDLGNTEEDKPLKIIDLWNQTFENKKTQYYTKLLEKEIYKGEALYIAKDIDIEPERKFAIRIDINQYNLENILDIIDKIENTFAYLTCLYYVIMKYIVSILIMKQKNITDELGKNLTQFDSDVKLYGSNLQKSSLGTFSKYEKDFDDLSKSQSGGNNLPFLIEIPSLIKENMHNVSFEKQEFELYTKYIESQTKNPNIEPGKMLKEVSKNLIQDLKNAKNITGELYDILAKKLGFNKKFNAIIKEIKDESNFENFDELVNAIENQLKNSQSGGSKIPKHIIKVRRQFGGSVSKPRLDPYKRELVNCLELIQKSAKYFPNLVNLLDKNKEGLNNYDQVINLENLKMLLTKIINKGRNNYIKIIPMIFFVIEFPPSIYLTNEEDKKDYYKFSYDVDTGKIKYTHILNNIEDGSEKYNGAHAAFFNDNNKNATSYLLTDPLISLDKILSVGNNENDPENKVLNMMFALGASGTGKTTRYFGKPDASNPLDRKGVVSFIIEKANSIGASSVDITYFVCYGQKKNIDNNVDTNYDEIILFFKEPKNTDDENNKYLPYYMPKTQIYKDVNGYTNFYKNLMNKHLYKLNYSDIKGFLNGDNLTLNSDIDVGPLRQLLQNKDEDIWIDISGGDTTKITKLFENLLQEQKKINTVMPTKNNIESSRGHTCVLVRFTYDKDGKKDYRYFPLFDMAGTEDPKGIKDFFFGQFDGKNINKNKMVQMMKSVNLYNKGTLSDEIDEFINGENKKKDIAIQSLNDMMKNSKRAKDYILQGGNTLNDIINEITQKNISGENSDQFLSKVVKESYYINHTIAMLIFASLCVGMSINSEKKDNTDEFNDIGKQIFNKLKQKNICLVKDIGNVNSNNNCTNTGYLLDDYTFDSILNKSSIWEQVLFSFLYWNNESDKSGLNILQNIKESDIPYVIEMKQQGMYLPETNITISEACKLDKGDISNAKRYIDELEKKGIKIDNWDENGIKIQNSDYNINPDGNIVSSTSVSSNLPEKNYNFHMYGNYDLLKSNLEKIGYLVKEIYGLILQRYNNGSFNMDELNNENIVKDFISLIFSNVKIYDFLIDDRLSTGSVSYIYKNNSGNSFKDDNQEQKKIQFILLLLKNPDWTKIVNSETGDHIDLTNVNTNIQKIINLFDRKKIMELFNQSHTKGVANNVNMFVHKMIQIYSFNKYADYIVNNQNTIKSQVPKYINNLAQFENFMMTYGKNIRNDDYDQWTKHYKKIVENLFEYINNNNQLGGKAVMSFLGGYYKVENIYRTNGNLDELNNMISDQELQKKNLFLYLVKENLVIGIKKGFDALKSQHSYIGGLLYNENDLKSFMDKMSEVILKNINNQPDALKSNYDSMENTINKKNAVELILRFKTDLHSLQKDLIILNTFLNLPYIDLIKNSTDNNDKTEENQMQRIIDGRSSATKMTLMHLVTGQSYKHEMVENTLALCQLLYDLTSLQLTENEQTGGQKLIDIIVNSYKKY